LVIPAFYLFSGSFWTEESKDFFFLEKLKDSSFAKFEVEFDPGQPSALPNPVPSSYFRLSVLRIRLQALKAAIFIFQFISIIILIIFTLTPIRFKWK